MLFSKFMAKDCRFLCAMAALVFMQFVGISTAHTEVPEKIVQYGEGEVDNVASLAIDDTGLYVAGRSDSANIERIYLRKVDSEFNTLWEHFTSGSLPNAYPDVAVYDGYVYLAGQRAGISFVEKLDGDGVVIWGRDFGSNNDLAMQVVVDDSGVYVAGLSHGIFPGQPSFGNEDVYLRKYDFAGNEIWTRVFGGRLSERPQGLVLAASGIYVGGSTYERFDQPQVGSEALFLRKFDKQGNVIWNRFFGDGISMQPDEGGLATDRGLVFFGGTGANRQIFAFDSAGKLIWNRDVPLGIINDVAVKSGLVYIAGLSLDWQDVTVHKLSASGVDVRSFDFGTDGVDVAYSILPSNGMFYVGGLTTGIFEGQTKTNVYQDAFLGKFLEFGIYRVISLGDINGDAVQDVAALVHDAAAGTLVATVKDVNNSLIGTVAFNGSMSPMRFIQLPDINSNGAPELVVLGTGSVKAEVRDSLTGNLLSTVNFNPNITPVDIGVVPDRDGNGIPELAVLGKHPTKGFVNVQTRDALTGNKIASTGFVPSFIPKQLLVLPDVDGNGMPEFAVLAVEDSADQFIKVEIRNFNGVPVRDIWLDQVSPDPLYMAMLDDMNGNGAVELATLRQKKDWVNVVVNDALSGAKLNSIGYNPNFAPLKLVVMPDLNGNGKQELAMFGKNVNTDGIKAEVRDASSGALVKDVWFWKVFTPQDLVTIPDISGNGKAELGMLGLRLSDGALRAYIKDVVTNTDIINVRF